jgi:hypothetical protein
MSFSRTVEFPLLVYGGFGSEGPQSGWLRTWALDVADDGTGLVVHELDAALSDTTTGACIQSVSVPFLSHDALSPASCCMRSSSRGEKVREISRTGSAKDTGDLDEVDGGLSGFHFVRL